MEIFSVGFKTNEHRLTNINASTTVYPSGDYFTWRAARL
jgi:hypothetical protein